jgi:hypothetical protein
MSHIGLRCKTLTFNGKIGDLFFILILYECDKLRLLYIGNILLLL